MSVRNAVSITIPRHCSAACFPIVTIFCCELAKLPFSYPVHCGDSTPRAGRCQILMCALKVTIADLYIQAAC